MNKSILAALVFAIFCNVGIGQITSGEYTTPDGGTVTVEITAPAPLSGNYTTTVSDKGGDAADDSSTPTGVNAGEVDSFGGNRGITTAGRDDNGNRTSGGTYRGRDGILYKKNEETDKWERCKKKPKKKKKKKK
jgi:hypothetical protein